jgi:hypothetical protein
MKIWKSSRLAVLLMFIVAVPSMLTAVTIYDIQYTEDPSGDSPLDGQIVNVTGIVTATDYYSSGNSNRFFISDPGGGAWSGIFCFNYDYLVEIGDEVEFTAEVDEYYGFTELKNLNNLIIHSSGNPLPPPVEVSTHEIATEEAYEGCLVRISGVQVTTAPNNYGEWYVNDGSGACQIDDGIYSYGVVSVGDEFYTITGVVDYNFSEYGINPRSSNDFIAMGMPIIDEIYTIPAFPLIDEDIQVRAKILDYDGLIMVAQIEWRIITETTGNWQLNNMGQLPGDLYSYTLGGLSNIDYYYEYRIIAEDDDGNIVESEIETIEIISESILLADINLKNSPQAGDSLQVEAVVIDPFAANLQVWLIYTKDYSSTEYLSVMESDIAEENLYFGSIPGQSTGTKLYIGIYAENDSMSVYYYNQITYTYPAKEHKAVLKVEPKPFDPYQRDSDPDNDTMQIEYFAQRGDRAIMRIYNSEGKLMLTPENKVITSNTGSNSYIWDGRDKNGQLLPWGLYICHLEVQEKDSGDVKTAQVPIVIAGPLK